MINQRTKEFVLMLLLLIICTNAVAVGYEINKDRSDLSINPVLLKPFLEDSFYNLKWQNHLILPAKDKFIAIFIVKLKNSELGYSLGPDRTNYLANVTFHIQIDKIEGHMKKALVNATVGGSFSIPYSYYNPQEENFYYLGYPLLPGKYILVASYEKGPGSKQEILPYEFEISDLAKFSKENLGLETTTILLLKDIEMMDSIEKYPNIHKDYFSWVKMRAYPYANNKIKPGDQPELITAIYGAKNDGNGKFQIEIKYDIRKDNVKLVDFSPMIYDTTFIQQPIPIPLSKQVIIKDEKGERKEDRPLEPGSYEIIMNIKDIMSGQTLEKRIPIEISK